MSFYPFTQDEYLAIAAQWLRGFGVPEDAIVAARQESLVWALERGSRSGRVAFQFAKDYAGRSAGAAGMRSAASQGAEPPAHAGAGVGGHHA
mgnify:CR=1 FL=1